MSTSTPATSGRCVLDASAVLAWVRLEPGAELVDPRLATGVMSAANWSEVWQKLHQHGADVDRATRRLRALGLGVEPVTAHDALAAAQLWSDTRQAGLSLADRCCLALAQRLDAPVLTADVAWGRVSAPVTIELIR